MSTPPPLFSPALLLILLSSSLSFFSRLYFSFFSPLVLLCRLFLLPPFLSLFESLFLSDEEKTLEKGPYFAALTSFPLLKGS